MADRGLLKITEEEFSGPPMNVSSFFDLIIVYARCILFVIKLGVEIWGF